MSDDLDSASTDDLRSILSRAHDDQMGSTALSDGVVKPAAAADDAGDAGDAAAGDGKTAAERARDASGKFVKKEDAGQDTSADTKSAPEAKKQDETKAAEDTAADTGKDTSKDTAKADDPKEKAIARWSASDKAMFRLQSPEAQDFLLRRNSQLESEFTKRNQALADLKREYEPVAQLFAPHAETLKQKGLNPASVIQRWASVETDLASGDPNRQMRILTGIVNGYGMDRSAVARALGITGSAPVAQQGTDQTATGQSQQGADDPAAQMLAALESRIRQTFEPRFAELDQMKQAQVHQARAAAAAAEARVDSEITEFKSATDDGGNVLHPYFDEVEPAMIALAQSYQASGQPIPKLSDLYEQAVWANPSTRQALLATQKAAQEAKATEEARAKAASARRAASSVTGAPGSGQATRPVQSERTLREQLEEAWGDTAA